MAKGFSASVRSVRRNHPAPAPITMPISANNTENGMRKRSASG